MIAFYLFLIFRTPNGGVSIHTTEYPSKVACEKAAKTVTDRAKVAFRITHICVPKGE